MEKVSIFSFSIVDPSAKTKRSAPLKNYTTILKKQFNVIKTSFRHLQTDPAQRPVLHYKITVSWVHYELFWQRSLIHSQAHKMSSWVQSLLQGVDKQKPTNCACSFWKNIPGSCPSPRYSLDWGRFQALDPESEPMDHLCWTKRSLLQYSS